ncbi:MAG: hypothetical protein RTU63_10760 [Candidatus Thorarchaeota archaeon]
MIKKEEDPIPEPIEEIVEEPIPETPSFSEDPPLRRPSDVASEQADRVDDTPATYEAVEEPPAPEEMRFESKEEEVSEPDTMDDERGREVVADILEKVRAAEARVQVEEDTAPSDTELEPPPAEPIEVEEPLVYEEPAIEAEEPVIEEAPEPEIITIEEPAEVAPVSPPAESAVAPSVETTEVPARDEKVRNLENEIDAHNIELGQLRSEFDALSTRLDDEVKRYHTVAEVKRTRTESIERDLSLAKKEYSAAEKEYKNAENHRKKEISNAEKRIREVEKRIKKAKNSRDKRLEDLEKERRKREEENR